MNEGPARASSGWLALREPADAAARSVELVDVLRAKLPTDGMRVHDLGCGTGSMVRWLAPRLDGSQHWLLYDRDVELLPLASSSAPSRAGDGAPVTVDTRCRDITRLDQHELSGADLITASALLDMLTGDELERLVRCCAGAGCPVLIALSVTGGVTLVPPDPLDEPVREAFNAHQRRSTGAGRLLGPDAVAAAVDELGRAGLDVDVRPSLWRLGPDDAALTVAWFTGWLSAACEQRPGLRRETASYGRRRLAEAAAGELTVIVEHADLLARPTRTGGAR